MFKEQEKRETSEFQLVSMPTQEQIERIRFIPRGEPLTFGATPLDAQGAYKQQAKLLQKLEKLVVEDVDESIPEELREYMRGTFAQRFWGRADANSEKYRTALRTDADCWNDPAVMEMIARAKQGFASPGELILVGEALGMQGIELGCVSHPYGKRIEWVDTMRQVVHESIVALGGTPLNNEETRFRVRGVVGGPMWQAHEFDGFLMTRKRNIGRMPNGTIIRERTSFILRADMEGIIPEECLEAMRQLDPKSPTWRADLVAAGNLDVISEALLSMRAFSVVLPVSSTIYAFNKEREAEIQARKAEIHARQAGMAGHMEPIDFTRYPALLEQYQMICEARQNGRTQDQNGISIGPMAVPYGDNEISRYLEQRRLQALEKTEETSDAE